MVGEGAIEMRRLSDGAVYRFVGASATDGAARYRREDKNIWIMRDPEFGWIVWDADENVMMGRPWDIPHARQGLLPPECEWVSKKGANSFVYALVFV